MKKYNLLKTLLKPLITQKKSGISQKSTAVFPAVRTIVHTRCFPRYKRLCERIAERFIVIRERKKIPIFIWISSSEIRYRRVRYLVNSIVHAAAAAMQNEIHKIPRVKRSAAAANAAQIIDNIQTKGFFFIVRTSFAL